MRCPRCGNENHATNRFCGMCGATLLPPADSAEVSSRGAASPGPAVPPAQPVATPTTQAAPRVSAPVTEETPAVSGPSFLGLNDPPPSPRRRTGLSIDPGSTSSSRNLDYLLEDDEEPRRGGAGKWILMLVALALAVGFGYLRWKGQSFNWLTSGAKKPSAAAPADDSSTSAPASNTPAEVPSPAANQAASPTANPSAQQPAAVSPSSSNPGAPNPGPPNAGAANSATANPPAPSAAPAGATQEPAPNATAPASPPASASTTTEAGAPSPVASPPVAAKDSGDEASNSTADVDKPKPAPAAPAKPAPTVRAPRAVDTVAEAQKYIYGKGAQQDCERGLRLLKPAADQSNAKAMIEMGALYSAGLCTPRDLPTAYRWFALALRKDPDNQAVQSDLQKLWGEMTQPERQLAIRLSQ